MGKFRRRGIGLLIAFLVTYTLASFFHTTFVLYGLSQVGVELDAGTFFTSLLTDWKGLILSYGMLLFAVLLVAFLGVSLIRRKITLFGGPLPRSIFPWCGATAMLLTHLAMFPVLNVTLIAGARGFWGLMFQCLAGFIGGYVYMKTVERLRAKAKSKAKGRRQKKATR